jgi:hypothetical protein
MKVLRRVAVVFGIAILVAAFGSSARPGFAQSCDVDKVHNLRNCLDGFGACDHSLLTSVQAKQVADIQHDRNLWGCLTGSLRANICETSLVPLINEQ